MLFYAAWIITLVLIALPAIPLLRWAWQFRSGVGPQGQEAWLMFVVMYAAVWAVLGAVNGFLVTRGSTLAWWVKFGLVPVGAGIVTAGVLVAGLWLAASARDGTTGNPIQVRVWGSVIVLALLFAVQIVVGWQFSR